MRAVVEVNLEAIKTNIRMLGSKTEASLLAVVKADAYGHGLVPVATTALEAGASWLGVALLEEAITLREAGIKAPLIAWLVPSGEDFEAAIRADIDLSISSISALEEILGVAKQVGRKPRLHIEVDTGMHRGGLLGQWEEFLSFAQEHRDEFSLIGFWSHFARADEPGESYNDLQLQEFTRKLDQLTSQGLTPEIIHFANSAATLNLPQAHHSMVRLGIAMYGLSPDRSALGSSDQLGLLPAMSVKAKLHLVKQVHKGDAIGYGGAAIASRDTTLGVVVMGYADGLPRIATNDAGALYDGNKAPLIGRVSMDQCVIDLGPESSAEAGDYVTLIGSEGYTADDWAKASGTINYEIVTRIATRVPRIYL